MTGDVMKGNGYVITENGRIIDYACISFDKEECYETLRGTWKGIQPYGAIYKLAIDSSCKGKGLGLLMLRRMEELCRSKEIHSIKIDTDQDGDTTRHPLEKNGYEYCGVVTFGSSNEIVFEKLI